MQNDTTQAQPLPTSGTINSRIGPLAFEGGYPTDVTVTKLYDEMDFQRATQAYIWAMPIVSFAKWQEQHEKVFGQEDGDLVLTVSVREKMGILTPNDTTPYLIGYLNLERTGPLVIDYPKGPTAGGILDMWQRPITDMGLSGPDKGEGGKYLVLPPGQKAPEGAEGYRVFESPTNNIFHALRVLATDLKEAESLKNGYQAYPYAKRDNPRKTRIIPAGTKKWYAWPATGLEFWQLVARMLNEEPVHERDRMIVAMLKPLGIEKGKKFEPDARQRQILEQAAVVGEAMARANTYASREKEARLWGPDNQWKLIILCAANQETEYHTALDERSAYFYEAVTLSDGMTTKTPGVGQAYMGVRKDKDGQWLQGGNNYTLRVPSNAPAKQFWALTLYDTETRSFIDTTHEIAGLDSRKELIKNDDGSVDLYIGPEAPKGKESN
ncbi:MAG: DUF1254 domain-containing protein, partial [Proteobacteria bacterium]|nr:DUF1254 domain-containing protein [Pseudomonadota bacterium]